MKKQTIDAVLMLSTVYDKRKMRMIAKDIQAIDLNDLDEILSLIEDDKQRNLDALNQTIQTQLEERKEQQKQRKKEKGTAAEVQQLLLRRHKMKPLLAIEKLTDRLSLMKNDPLFEGSPTAANFKKWVETLCQNLSPDDVLDAALKVAKE